MSKAISKYITVFIPTFNGEQYLAECINMVLTQNLPVGYSLELLVIDSGSTDKTLSILNRYTDSLKLVQIPNSEFSHGGTRSKAAHIAKGEFVLFLTQDATPANESWIKSMIEPFFMSDKVGCVFGKQIPRQNAAATIKREVSGVFGGLGARDSIIIHRSKSLLNGAETNPINTFFSDVNSAVRRDLLVGPVPFKNVNYAEDQSLAEDMQKKGYLKAYAPQGEVWHSNEYTPKEYFHRKFDEYIGLQESVGLSQTASIRSLLLGWARPTWQDWKFIISDGEYRLKSRIVWFIKSPLYNLAGKAGMYYAFKCYSDPDKRKKLSLEYKARSS